MNVSMEYGDERPSAEQGHQGRLAAQERYGHAVHVSGRRGRRRVEIGVTHRARARPACGRSWQKRDTALTVPIEMLWSPPMKIGSVPSRSRARARSWISPVQAPISPKILAAQGQFARVGRVDRGRQRHVPRSITWCPSDEMTPGKPAVRSAAGPITVPATPAPSSKRNPEQGYRLRFACLFHTVPPCRVPIDHSAQHAANPQ